MGEEGDGFKQAMKILDGGRISIAALSLGIAKGALAAAAKYAQERQQFGQAIVQFQGISFKLADMATKVHAAELMTRHAAELKMEGTSMTKEAAMAKYYASEIAVEVSTDAVQIFGGMGYSAESSVERAYRDSRINRIFEGTNEINRMLIVEMVLRRAMKGELDLMGPAMAVANELMSIPEFGEAPQGTLGAEQAALKGFKKVILMAAGSAVQKLMNTLSKEQEVLMGIADIAIIVYEAESALLRVQKLIEAKGEAAAAIQIAIVKTYFYDAADKINKLGKDVLNSFAEGDELKMMVMGLKRFTKNESFNTKEARRRVADKLITENKYCF